MWKCSEYRYLKIANISPETLTQILGLSHELHTWGGKWKWSAHLLSQLVLGTLAPFQPSEEPVPKASLYSVLLSFAVTLSFLQG